jgi:Flp pilus assembly protein TadG
MTPPGPDGTLAFVDLARDQDRGPRSTMAFFFAVSFALLALVLLIPVVTAIGALIGFMVAAHLV